MLLELGPEGWDGKTGEGAERKAFQGEGAVCSKVRNHQDPMCLWESSSMLLVQRRGRGRTRGGFGLDTIHNGEQGTASQEASDMSECVLTGVGGAALWFDSTKGLEKGRMVLAQALPTCTVARFYHLSSPPYSFNFDFLECRFWLSLEVPRASRPMGLQMEVN